MTSPPSFEGLLAALQGLPGIGPKSARRIAHHVLSISREEFDEFISALTLVRERTRFCSTCHAMTETDLCTICTDESRDQNVIAVVETPRDVEILEKTGEFKGRYHVLGGLLAPLKGIGPDHLAISDLVERIRQDRVREVLLATSPNVEGEATALYLARRLKTLGAKITRLASGLPVGTALEFADEATLARSLSGRREI